MMISFQSRRSYDKHDSRLANKYLKASLYASFKLHRIKALFPHVMFLTLRMVPFGHRILWLSLILKHHDHQSTRSDR